MLNLKHNDKIKVDGNRVLVFTLKSFCLDNGIQEKFDSYIQRGEKQHSLELLGAMVTLGTMEDNTLASYSIGDSIKIEGKIFNIDSAPNKNYSLK